MTNTSAISVLFKFWRIQNKLIFSWNVETQKHTLLNITFASLVPSVVGEVKVGVRCAYWSSGQAKLLYRTKSVKEGPSERLLPRNVSFLQQPWRRRRCVKKWPRCSGYRRWRSRSRNSEQSPSSHIPQRIFLLSTYAVSSEKLNWYAV